MELSHNLLRDALVKIALLANSKELPFLLVGGNALIYYGVPRFTRDIDFLIPESSELHWTEFLEEAGFICFNHSNAFLQYDGKASGNPPVDIMIVSKDTWNTLLASARMETLTDELKLLLPTPLHLMAMKLQAYRNPLRSAREQDWGDIMHLVRHHIQEIREEEFQKLVIRHGGISAWNRMEKELNSNL